MAERSKKPDDSDFQQQRLKAWQPLLTPTWVIGTFAFVGFVFLAIGIVVQSASSSVVEVTRRYDNDPAWQSTNCNITSRAGCNFTMTLNIEETMEPPIYFYYKLSNFYQNHRRYVKSRSDGQLKGDTGASISSCEPLERFDEKKLYPCGLIANSLFNDTFTSMTVTSGGSPQPVDATNQGIAWSSDREDKFNARATAADELGAGDIGPGGVIPSVDDEEFIVWMRTAGLPTFKKLHRKINTKLEAGSTFSVEVSSIFPVSGFDGEKAIVLSTTSWLGGKNDFLGYAYITVGSLCLLLAIVFVAKQMISPRVLGEMKYFNIPCNSGAAQ